MATMDNEGTTTADEEEKAYLITKEKLKASNGFGGKTIGFIGGFSLLVSNLTGPGLVSLSLVYQDSGWLTPSIALVVMMLMSTLSAVFLCEAMATLPGNESLQGRVEFTTLVRFFFGRKGHILAQIFINVALQATNIAGIVISSQVMDSMFVAFFHKTCGLELHPLGWTCVSGQGQSESPFGNAIMLFTLGYLVVMCVIIPLGYLNLDDNIIIQIVALLFLLGVVIDWIVSFVMSGLKEHVPMITTSQVNVLGTVMFNFAYITTVPSWVNEKKPSVSIHQSLWSAGIVATASFFLVGYLGARAFHMDEDSDILSVINASDMGSAFNRQLSHILVYLFPLMVLATSIPVYSIIVRYNLLQNKVCSKLWANLFAVVFPWAVAIPFLSGGALNYLINWSSLVFASTANFIIPFILYIKACNFRLREREHLTEEQHEILKSMHDQVHPDVDALEPPPPSLSFRRFSLPPTPYAPIPSSRLPTGSASHRILSSSSSSSSRAIISASHKSLPTIIVTAASSTNISLPPPPSAFLPSPPSRDRLLPTNAAINASTSSYSNIPSSLSEGRNEEYTAETPLPPEFMALPYSTPESSRVVAWLSVVFMTGLVVGVLVLAVY